MNKSKACKIRIGDVFAQLYEPEKNSNKVIISLAGAPSLGDNSSVLGELATKHGFALLRPDYIGHQRSSGNFSFANCIETVRVCEKFLTGKTVAEDLMRGTKINRNYDQMFLFGSSFAGAVIPFAVVDSNIIEIVGLVAPVTDWKALNIHSPTGVLEFNLQMKGEFKEIYKGYAKSDFEKITRGIVQNKNPISNTSGLKDKQFYVYHGNKDTSIPWEHSLRYVNKLKQEGLMKKVHFELLRNHKHSSNAVLAGLERFIKEQTL